MWGGGDFGGPVTEGGSHTKKVGDHCSRWWNLCLLRAGGIKACWQIPENAINELPLWRCNEAACPEAR